MTVPASPTRIYEACFVEMGKTLRTAQFYPLTHPAFNRSLERSYLYVSQLLKRVGVLEVTITKTHLVIQDRKVTGNTNVLSFMASEMFRRRIKLLHFDPATELRDYQALFRVLSTDSNKIQAGGGPEKMLAQAGARNIWSNAMRFEATQLAEWEEDDDEEAQDEEQREEINDIISDAPAQHPELQSRLENLTRAKDPAQMKAVLGEIIGICRDAASSNNHIPSTMALQVISRIAYKAGVEKAPGRLLVQAIRSIATKDVVEAEIRRITHGLGNVWEHHSDSIVLVGPPALPFLFHALARSDSRKDRTRLLSTIQRFGNAVQEPAIQLLQDKRWFVVRNAIELLGNSNDPDVIPVVCNYIDHDHPKVRNAARTAARKLGGERSMDALLEAVDKGDETDRRHAVSQLTFFPAQAVLPKILEVVDKAPVSVAEEAFRVLSELDPPDMVQFLEKTLADRGGLFNKKKKETMRRAAAELVCLRLPDTWNILKQYATDPDPEIRKWVARGVEWMQRAKKRNLLSA